jgi:hypothetical protein
LCAETPGSLCSVTCATPQACQNCSGSMAQSVRRIRVTGTIASWGRILRARLSLLQGGELSRAPQDSRNSCTCFDSSGARR